MSMYRCPFCGSGPFMPDNKGHCPSCGAPPEKIVEYIEQSPLPQQPTPVLQPVVAAKQQVFRSIKYPTILLVSALLHFTFAAFFLVLDFDPATRQALRMPTLVIPFVLIGLNAFLNRWSTVAIDVFLLIGAFIAL